jgi:nucleoside-diphosphate-sugar epimerase
MSITEFKVCVTGASGYLGSWIVKMCLEKGWTVAATTRSIERHGDRLRALVPEAVGRLQLFEAELLDAKTFEAAFTGCDVLLHVASPFFGGGESTYDDFVGPAVQGTEGVLRLAKQLNITKVVVTSSCASIMGGHCDPPPPLFTEEIWSDIEYLTKIGSNYSISKTLAERKAWDLASELGIQVAVMNPGYIFGPVLQPSINTSTGVLYKYIVGKNTEISNASVNFADVSTPSENENNLALFFRFEMWPKPTSMLQILKPNILHGASVIS